MQSIAIGIGVIAMSLFAVNAETAKGTFSVKTEPAPGGLVDRMLLDKAFEGDLTGTSKGEMLASVSAVKGSAGYVAIEKVSATLAGRKGSFVLQHWGTMAGGKQELKITVVPDSGTDGLAGLTGNMSIRIEGKQHFYEFHYTLPATGAL